MPSRREGRGDDESSNARDGRSDPDLCPHDRVRGFQHGILVTTKTSVQDVREHYGAYFARLSDLGQVEAGRGGRHELTLYLCRCEALTRRYPVPYR